MSRYSWIIPKELIKTIQLDPIWPLSEAKWDRLIFRIEIFSRNNKLTAMLWRLEMYNLFPYGFLEQKATESIFILDETTIPNINNIEYDTLDEIESYLIEEIYSIFKYSIDNSKQEE